ncbi:MAG: PAS domain-containing protein [Bacillus sp. (in: firmicutes)]
MSIELHPKLIPYIKLVDFLGSVMGTHCEVVLHDVRNIENSIVAIKNSQISNRKEGGPLTDLALKILKDKSYVKKDFLINYSGRTEDGNIVRSSTFFIKGSEGEVLGMLCFNMDVSYMVDARNILDSIINGLTEVSSNGLHLHGHIPGEKNNPIEGFHTTIEELTESIIIKALSETTISAERMSPDEKIDIIKQLNEQGIFLIKGSVSEVAKYLKTSEATIYRYLNKIDSKQ